MRLLIGIACVLVCMAGVEAKTPDNVYLEFTKLFTSHASSHFPTENDYIESHRQFETRIMDVNNKLTDRAHSFVVQLEDSCTSHCHDALLNKFSSKKYSIYNKNHGTIYASLDEIKEFQASNPGMITHLSPVHPDMKIDTEIREVSTLPRGCYPTPLKTKTLTSPSTDIKIQAPVHRVRVKLMPLKSADEVKEFLDFVEDLKKQHKNQFTFEFRKKQKHTKGMVGFIVTNRCDKVTVFATAMAQRREVTWMEIDHPFKVHNRWSRGICDTGDAANTPLTAEGLLGDGEIVGVSDTGLDLTSCYFYDDRFNATNQYKYQYDTGELVMNDHRNVIQYVAYIDNRDDSTEAHGTHVAGSVAGLSYENHGDYSRYNGMAYNAKISFYDIGYATDTRGTVSPPGDLNDDLFSVQYQAGARIFSNSWGNGNNGYDSSAREVDQFMWEYPDACVLFSAGNTGINGFNTAGSPSINKNGICVGASLNNYDSWRANTDDTGASKQHDIESVAYFSSKGPSEDGRMKPDILAPGWYVQSAKGGNNTDYHCDVHGLSGTSMATPTAAGFAARVRQYYRTGYYPSGQSNRDDEFIPSGALIKATLIHSGQPMKYIIQNNTEADDVGDYPNNVQGYGRIMMNKVLNFGTSTTNPISLFVVGAVNSSYGSKYQTISSSSLSKSFTFQTPSGTQSALRITLCYTDYYTGSGSSSSMVNILSLSVSDGHGNTFTPSYSDDMIQSNAQMVDIDASDVTASSTYTVTVSASSVSQTQPFALVVTGSLTYLDDYYETAFKAPSHSATYISAGATIDIILLAIAVFLLCSMVYFFSRLTKRSRNLEYDPYAARTPQGAGIMGTVQRMRMAAIEKQRQSNASHPTAPKKQQKKKQAGGGPNKKPQHTRHQQPQQDYVYNPRDFE